MGQKTVSQKTTVSKASTSKTFKTAKSSSVKVANTKTPIKPNEDSFNDRDKLNDFTHLL